jgi:hypothetical protein
MNNSEGPRMNLGEFDSGSKGARPDQEALFEQQKREKEERDFAALLEELNQKGCEALVTYLTELSPEKKKKINTEFNMEGRDITFLKWAEADKQEEITALLDSIYKTEDIAELRKIRLRVMGLL